MTNEEKIVPRFVDTSEDHIPEEKVPGTVILTRDSERAMFDDFNGDRHDIKDPSKLPLSGGSLEGDVNLGPHQISKDYSEGVAEDLSQEVLVNKGEALDLIPQSDYEENDKTSKSYIKNRPFYQINDIIPAGTNILKNPVYYSDLDVSVIDSLGLKPGLTDLSVTLSGRLDDGTVATQQIDNLATEILPLEAIGIEDIVGLLIYDENSNDSDPMILDKVVLTETGAIYDPSKATIFAPVGEGPSQVFDISFNSNVETSTLKLLDDQYYRTTKDYADNDPQSREFINNKIVNDSSSQVRGPVHVLNYIRNLFILNNLGLNDSYDTPEGQYNVELKFKDGTSKVYTTVKVESSDNPYPEDLKRARNLVNEDGEVIAQMITVLPVNSEDYLVTSLLVATEESLEVVAVTILGPAYFYNMTSLSKKLVQGLNKDLSDISGRIDDVNKLVDSTSTSLSNLTSTKNAMLYNEKLHLDSCLRNYENLDFFLYRAPVGRASTPGTSLPSGFGRSSKPIDVVAKTLVSAFEFTKFVNQDLNNTLPSYDPPCIYLNLLNAEDITKAFKSMTLNYARASGDTTSRKCQFVITLGHDIVASEDSFYEIITNNVVGLFKIVGKGPNGERIKFAGNTRNTFTVQSYWVDSNYQFVIENLDFMDSVYFASQSPVAESVELMVNIIDQLHDYSGEEEENPVQRYCTFGSTGKSLLSEEQIAVARAKGWQIN